MKEERSHIAIATQHTPLTLKGVRGIAMCLLVGCAAWQIASLIGWALEPFPIEYREWANVDAAMRFFSPDGPYGDAEGTGIYLYGLLYPLCGALAGKLSGDVTLGLMRTLSIGFTLLTALLVSLEVKRGAAKEWQLTMALSAFNMLLAVGWQGVPGVAVSAPLGTLLLVLTLLALKREQVVLSALFAVLAFYVKPYFVAIALPSAVYLWQAIGPRACARYIIILCSLAVGSVLAVRAVFPFYFVYNVVHHLAAASRSLPHLLHQLGWIGLLYAPLWLLLCRGPWRRDAYAVATFCMVLVFLWVGGHVGADMTYFLHLVLPPLALCALPRMELLQPAHRAPMLFAIIALPLMGGAWRFYCPRILSGEERRAWTSLHEMVERLPQTAIVCSPCAAPLAAQRGLTSFDNGQAQYVSSLYLDNKAVSLLFPEQRALRQRASTFEPNLRERISRHEWPVVVVDTWSLLPANFLLQAGYERTKVIPLRCGRHELAAEVWIPQQAPLSPSPSLP